MGATWYEQELAQKHGVFIREWSKPVNFEIKNEKLKSVQFECTEVSDGKLQGTGEYFELESDMVFSAIGQHFSKESLNGNGEIPKIKNGKILVDQSGKTSMVGVFAGGDCTSGNDLTVTAVNDGKLAGQGINEFLMGGQ